MNQCLPSGTYFFLISRIEKLLLLNFENEADYGLRVGGYVVFCIVR